MRLSLQWGVTVIALAIAGTPAAQAQQQPARGDCAVVRANVEQQVADDPNVRAEYGAPLVRDLRQMRNVALRLQQYGEIEACEQVALAMQNILADPAAYQERTGSTGSYGVGTGQADVQTQAVPLAQGGNLRAEAIIGTDVRTSDGETVGEVDDVIVGGDDQDAYLIVAHGGFLGIGQQATAVPFDVASLSGNQDVVFINMTRDQFESAPTVDRSDFGWLNDDDWRRSSDQYFSSSN